jgi:hypothetical protein
VSGNTIKLQVAFNDNNLISSSSFGRDRLVLKVNDPRIFRSSSVEKGIYNETQDRGLLQKSF